MYIILMKINYLSNALIILICTSAHAMELPLMKLSPMEFPPAPSKQDKQLFTYIQNGSFRSLEKKLNNGASIETRDDWGQTLLHAACGQGQLGMVASLLKRGADVHARTPFTRQTPVYWAIGTFKESADIVKLLLAYGADATVQDCEKHTPLYVAAENGLPELVTVILVHARYFANHTRKNIAMHDAVKSLTDYRVKEGKKLIEIPGANERTPLQMVRFNLEILSERTDLEDFEVARKIGLGELLPFLEPTLFEQNFKELIKKDVIKILSALPKKRR